MNKKSVSTKDYFFHNILCYICLCAAEKKVIFSFIKIQETELRCYKNAHNCLAMFENTDC